jgi:hypothetical protein
MKMDWSTNPLSRRQSEPVQPKSVKPQDKKVKPQTLSVKSSTDDGLRPRPRVLRQFLGRMSLKKRGRVFIWSRVQHEVKDPLVECVIYIYLYAS